MDQIENPQRGAPDGKVEEFRKSLGRDDLLKALDSEIAERETEVSRLGLSTWGLTGAFVGVLWLIVNELLDNRHKMTETLLVFFTGFFALGILRSVFGETVTIRTAYNTAEATRRYISGRHYWFRIGIHPDFVPYLLVENLILLTVAVMLGLQGFVTLSVVSTTFLAIMGMLLVVGFVVTMVRFPFLEAQLAQQSRPSLKVTWGIRTVVVLLLSLQIAAIIQTSATISKDDWRLGLLLAALLTIAELCARLIRPAPDLVPLKSIRSRLAFGWIDLPRAQVETESLLLGLPQDSRLASKALEIIETIHDKARLVGETADTMDEIIKMAMDLENSTDKVGYLEGCRERAVILHKQLQRSFSKITNPGKRRDTLKNRFRREVRIASNLGYLSTSEEARIKETINTALKAEHEAAARIKIRVENFKTSMDKLMSAFGGKIESKLPCLQWKEVLATMFDE